jgi:hypothetical protein
MKKYLVFLLIITFVLVNCSVVDPVDIATDYAIHKIVNSGKTKRGATMMIQTNDRQEIIGELIVVKKKDNSLILLHEKMGELSVDIKDVKIIQIYLGTKVKKGAAIGLLAGGLTGVFLGFSSGDDPPDLFSFTAEMKAIFFGLAGGAIGTFVGLCIGSSISDNVTILIEGRSDTEINEIFEGMRQLARVPEFQ